MSRSAARRWHGRLSLILAPLILLWCVSGAVMLFVPFPDFPEPERRAGLEPLAPDSDELLALEDATWPTALIDATSLQVERLGPHLVLRTLEGGVFDAVTGSEMGPLDLGLLDGIARSAVTAPAVNARWIEIDQWTVSGRLHRHRPLRRIAFGDPEHTALYVSGRTGEIVQRTRRHERRWNQVGAVAHWIYWTEFRRHAAAWSWTVVVLSALATATLCMGSWVGLRRERPESPARRRHRLLGWTVGSVLILWTASGLLSMNPFGLLASPARPWHASFPLGAPPSCTTAVDLRPALHAALRAPEARSARFIRVGALDGEAAAWIDGADPPRRDRHAAPAPLDPDRVRRAVAACGGPDLLDFAAVEPGDPYRPPGPAAGAARLRARLDDPAATWIEFDGDTGEVVRRLDRNGRIERWLHRGLHTLDVLGPVRNGPLGRPVVLGLLVAATLVVLSGWTLRRGRSVAGLGHDPGRGER